MRFIYPAVAVAVMAVPQSVQANPIQRACMASDQYSSRSLCSCIGDAADVTLSRRQMREGARWFDDPQRAQDTRQSDRARDEEMWSAWRTFSTLAEQSCG
ncbi:hypothetical protein [Gymnodinialimonas ceratoperidinii]|uniref:Secreted protein n=1 Tax=Gymnodinialimonas ceratoperidinii TaxID=2856823 RepID=A0A8F6YBM1_9RHOB|nr:hypothetical protein [Gymnodinialimonas ceratoperidinii]QXT40703.1 hypothetical protein KYE46_05565 [Gymnodinialimonas ceratoperidinii]